MSLITVVIPVYQSAATVAATVRSALDQTWTEIEVIAVDDGSTDGSADIALSAAAGDPRFSVIRQRNAGVATARNTGLAAARGSYVAWLDADDLWHPTKLEKELALFRAAQEPLAFVYTGYRLIDAEDRIIPNFRTLADVSGHTLCRQIATNFFSNVSSIMVPTALVRRLGGHDAGLRQAGIEGAEDLMLQLRLSRFGPCGCVREALVGYRMHGANMSRAHHRAALSNLFVIDSLAALDPDLPPWVIRMGRARVVGYALHLAAARRPGEALDILRRIFPGQPRETLCVLWEIARWKGAELLDDGRWRDPAIGLRFAEADPATVPWRGHMILPERHRRRLETEDALRGSRVGPAARPDRASAHPLRTEA